MKPKELTKGMGIPLCPKRCKELYLYNTEMAPGQVSKVIFFFRCARCGAEHLGQLDEYFIAKCLMESQRMADNENPPSCPL